MSNRKDPKIPLCCICKKKKAEGAFATMNDGNRAFTNFYGGACNNAKCILARQREMNS